MKDIKGFFGQYSWLSNFHPAVICVDGLSFPTVEHGFVYAKVVGKKFSSLPHIVKELGEMTPREAKRWGRKVQLCDNWDKIKVDIMRDLVHLKFTQNTELRDKLLDTDDCHIEETNTWKDTYWGVCRGVGKNMLGEILMATRTAIKSEYLFS